MAERPIREFGVPDTLINPPFGDTYQTGLIPGGAINNLEWQQGIEQAARDAEAEAAQERAFLAEDWDRVFKFGPVVKPKQETLRGYKYVLRQGDGVRNLNFSPYDYGVFDNIILQKFGVDGTGKSTHAAFNADHPYYESYAPLRRNLAVLRNYLLCSKFPDEVFMPESKTPEGREDAANFQAVQKMAGKLGDALAGGSHKPSLFIRWFHSLKKFFTRKDMAAPEANAFLQSANIPDKGIAAMYNYLLSKQTRPSFTDKIPFMGSSTVWNLKPIEETPFSDGNIAAYSRSRLLEGIALAFERVTQHLESVDTLSAEDKRVSVEHGRNILEKLRLTLADSNEEAKISPYTDPKLEEARMMLQAALAFKSTIADLAKVEGLPNSSTFTEAREALLQMSHRIKVEAYLALKDEGDTAAAEQMAQRIVTTPARFNNMPITMLAAKLNKGLAEAAGLREAMFARGAQLQVEKAPEVEMDAKTAVENIIQGGRDKVSSATARISQVSEPGILRSVQKANERQVKDAAIGSASLPGRK